MEEFFVSLLNRLSARGPRRERGERRPLPEPHGWLLGTPDSPGLPGESGAPVTLEEAELDRHCYALGRSGCGKSRFLELLLRQHIRQKCGFCLIDPHGDLLQSLLAFLYEEWCRREGTPNPVDLQRLYLVEPFREDGVVGLNPLDPGGGLLYPHVGELVGIFRRVWANSWGPRMEECLRSVLLALGIAGYTLTEVAPFLTEERFRAHVLSRVPDEAVRAYWAGRYDPLSAAARAAISEPVLNKIGALLADPRLRAMLGQRESLDLRRRMDEGSWVLVNCSKGQLRDASFLLGSFLVAQLQAAAMSRADVPEERRRPFTLVVDEFQNFRTEDFETLLCEARKYRLRLVFAHQHLGQLDPSLQNAILGNVATSLFFAVSPKDAGIVARSFPDGDVTVPGLVHLPVGRALLSRKGQPPVRIRVPETLTPDVDAAALARFAASLRQAHGRPLPEIEAEIRQRQELPLAGPEPAELRPGGGSPDGRHPGGRPSGRRSAGAGRRARPGVEGVPAPQATPQPASPGQVEAAPGAPLAAAESAPPPAPRIREGSDD